MKRLSVLGSLLMVMLLSVNAVAQDEDEYAYNDILEFALYGGVGVPGGDVTEWGDSLSLGATSGWSIGFDFGYFVSPRITIGVNLIYTRLGVDTDAGTDLASDLNHHLYTPNLYLKYHFVSETNWLPYLKGQVGLENAKFVTAIDRPSAPRVYRELSYSPSLSVAAGAGIFYYVHDYGGLFLEANYRYSFTEDAEKELDEGTRVFGSNMSTIDVHAGIRVIFGSSN